MSPRLKHGIYEGRERVWLQFTEKIACPRGYRVYVALLSNVVQWVKGPFLRSRHILLGSHNNNYAVRWRR